MKESVKRLLWAVSLLLIFLSVCFFTAGFLPGLLMMLCAISANPILIERFNRYKGLTVAFLILGLLVASVAALPKSSEQANAYATQREVIRSAASEALDSIDIDEQAPVNLEYDENSPLNWSVAAALPKSDPSPYKWIAPTATLPTVTSQPIKTEAPDSLAGAGKSTAVEGIEIVYYTETIARGEYASIEIIGKPNTTYNCKVDYKSGPSKAKGLGDQDSDGEGYVEWEWKVGTNTSLDYRPTITVSGGGDSVSVRFQVVE
ncbi:MAG: hypothetical protein VB091_11850 [Christensenella sp.]|nr:hypothetical protein [Christensenella sp.]